jgi:hypothetical protein
MPSHQKRHVFTYQTRVLVTSEQDKMLREYAVRFGRVERTLYRDLRKGEDANRLKSVYLVRFAITAGQFNAVRIQLQGKVEAIRRQLPLQVANLKRRIESLTRPRKALEGRGLGRHASLHPLFEQSYVLCRPRAVTRHAAVF